MRSWGVATVRIFAGILCTFYVILYVPMDEEDITQV